MLILRSAKGTTKGRLCSVGRVFSSSLPTRAGNRWQHRRHRNAAPKGHLAVHVLCGILGVAMGVAITVAAGLPSQTTKLHQVSGSRLEPSWEPSDGCEADGDDSIEEYVHGKDAYDRGSGEEYTDENSESNATKDESGEESDAEEGDAREEDVEGDTDETDETDETWGEGGEESDAEKKDAREEDAEEEDAERSDADKPLKDGWEPWVRTWIGADGAFEPDPEVLCFVVGSGIDTRHSDFFPGQIKRLTRPECNSVPKLEDSSYTVPRHVEDGKILQQLTHETGVASAIAGRMSGMAPGAILVDVEADIKTSSSEHPVGLAVESLESRLEDIAQYLSANPSKAIVNLSFALGDTDNVDRETIACKRSQCWAHPPPPREWCRADHAIAKITESGALVVAFAGNKCCLHFQFGLPAILTYS
ncbi:hypothetical protein LTR37_017795 [Vermiconidia calcicola]|uniref:Uncharacterized protein n=1 Tax=Vermiconidia calcicola TaxID=1690605 RepID=A0ACC3MK71_9PEZI|nr:hypothetical protein LTR37_017795 [Vermiconidia calcicola]